METRETNFLPFYKRTFIINRQYQLGFVLRLLGLVLAGAAVFMVMFYLLSQGMMSVSYEHYDLRVGEASNMLMPQVLTATFIYLLLTGLTVTVITILTSHRMAGPIYRIARTVEEMHRGNLVPRIRLRKKDSSSELADALNRLLDEYADRLRMASANTRKTLEHVMVLKQSGKGGTEEMVELEGELRAVLNHLAFFRTDDDAGVGL